MCKLLPFPAIPPREYTLENNFTLNYFDITFQLKRTVIKGWDINISVHVFVFLEFTASLLSNLQLKIILKVNNLLLINY